MQRYKYVYLRVDTLSPLLLWFYFALTEQIRLDVVDSLQSVLKQTPIVSSGVKLNNATALVEQNLRSCAPTFSAILISARKLRPSGIQDDFLRLSRGRQPPPLYCGEALRAPIMDSIYAGASRLKFNIPPPRHYQDIIKFPGAWPRTIKATLRHNKIS